MLFVALSSFHSHFFFLSLFSHPLQRVAWGKIMSGNLSSSPLHFIRCCSHSKMLSKMANSRRRWRAAAARRDSVLAQSKVICVFITRRWRATRMFFNFFVFLHFFAMLSRRTFFCVCREEKWEENYARKRFRSTRRWVDGEKISAMRLFSPLSRQQLAMTEIVFFKHAKKNHWQDNLQTEINVTWSVYTPTSLEHKYSLWVERNLFIASDGNSLLLRTFMRSNTERENGSWDFRFQRGEKKTATSRSVNYYYFRRNLIDKSDCDVFDFAAAQFYHHPFLVFFWLSSFLWRKMEMEKRWKWGQWLSWGRLNSHYWLGVREDFSHLLELGDFLTSIGCFFGCLNSTSRVNYFRNLIRHSVLYDAVNQFVFWGHSWNFHQGKMCQNYLTFAAAHQNIFRWHRNDRFLLNPQNIGNNKLQNKKKTNNNNRMRKI